MINRNSGETIYKQIQKHLELEIKTYHRPNDLLPAESVLANRFGVNRHTLRRAIDGLVAEGWVERRHGLGCFVLEKPLDYDISRRTRFTENIEALGKLTQSHVLRKLIVRAHGGIARRLDIDEGAEVLWIETLRSVDQLPFCLISHYLPKHLLPELETSYQGGSLHELIEQVRGWSLQRSESVISSALPIGDDAHKLRIPSSVPILRVKSVNVRAHDQLPIEYSITRFRADRMQLRVSP